VSFKRVIQAAIFILLHSLAAVLIMSYVAPSWVIGCGVVAAAFGTLLLILFAGDEASARLFFFENWAELEETNNPLFGLVFVMVGCIWTIPVICFLLALAVVLIRRIGWL